MTVLTEARHPDVGGDVDADPVVPLLGGKHVVPDEHHLHPTLPFLRLVPVSMTTRTLSHVIATKEHCYVCGRFDHKSKMNDTVAGLLGVGVYHYHIYLFLTVSLSMF